MLNTESTERCKRKRCTCLACVLWTDMVLMGQRAKKGGRDLSTKQDLHILTLPDLRAAQKMGASRLNVYLPHSLRFRFHRS